MMDRNGNTLTQKLIYKEILEALEPTNIDTCVDRDKYPLTGTKPLNLYNHIALCSGYRTKYVRSK